MASAADIALVRSLAPEFSDDGTYTDAMITARWDGWATAVTGRRAFRTRYQLAVAYATAHRLTLDLRGSGGTGSGSGSASVGTITSATVGPQSITYGGSATAGGHSSAFRADMEQTTYGMAWLSLWGSRRAIAPKTV